MKLKFNSKKINCFHISYILKNFDRVVNGKSKDVKKCNRKNGSKSPGYYYSLNYGKI